MASGLFTLKQQVQALRQGAWDGQKPPAVEYLVVAGGGGGGSANTGNGGGGGGGGGLLAGISSVSTGSPITVTVGAAGSGTTAGGSSQTNGGNSVFGSVTAFGGGYGGNGYNGITTPNSGGSGGGGGASTSAPLPGANGVVNQGNKGGAGCNTLGYNAGGGGGAGTIGLDYTRGKAGNGGAGVASVISGVVNTYSGGGGGGAFNTALGGVGGVGGGGNGGSNTTGTAGATNTGGGGGGAGGTASSSNGGSGIVIISYPDLYAAPVSTTGSPTVSTSGSGSIAFNGSNQYLNYAAQTPFSMGSGDFTIEFWAYPTGGLANYPGFIDFRGSSSSSPAPYIYNNNGILVYGTAGADRISYTYSTLNTWIHVAVVRFAGVTKMYLNGTQVGSSYTDSNNYTVGTGAPYIGQNGVGGGYFTGYMSNIRIVKGVGVYTGTFTPSTTPLQATQSAGTNIAAITGTQTSLLLPAISGGLSADISTNAYSVSTTSSASPTWNSASPFTGTGYKNRVYTWTSSGSITF